MRNWLRRYYGNLALAGAVASVMALLIFVPLLRFGFKESAAFLGTLLGATIGFTALIVGHLYGDHLNRRRDKLAKLQDSYACTIAIFYEVSRILGAIQTVCDHLAGRQTTHRALMLYVPQFSDEVFRGNVVAFSRGLAQANGVMDINNISAFYANVALFGGAIKEGSEEGHRLITADEANLISAKARELLPTGTQTVRELRLLLDHLKRSVE